MHYLPSTLYVYSILLDAVSDYHGTPPVKPYNTAVAIACTDDLFGLYLVDLHIVLCYSYLSLQNNQLQQLPAGVFSNLTSLRSLTCVVVCIENVCVHVCV
jgi:hypothetical protein